MIKFIDIKNNQVFDGSSYVKVSTCPKCGYTVKGDYFDELINICPFEFEVSTCNDSNCKQPEFNTAAKHFHKCNTPMVETITGPHYVFWIDGEQSTDLYYVKEICVLTDDKHGFVNRYNNKHVLNVSINENDVFKIIDTEKIITNNPDALDNINGFTYQDLNSISSNNCEIYGEQISDGLYVHMIYILAKSTHEGEFKEDFFIDNVPYTIGADFYKENESLYINLMNFGFEITEDIQKSIYEKNVHEDYRDNILINRKLKELLINYWDIIANKGSYKSLINSLNWFEWGDLLRVREIWKHDAGDKIIYDDRKLTSILEDKYKDSLSNFSKTTFISLYTTLEKLVTNSDGGILYDEELNPQIEFISTKWAFRDLSLKMSLLGKFYETFFMPIHLDLIHSTIEDIVFENLIKINQSASLYREDHVYNFGNVTSNISDDSIFYLSNISQPIPENSITVIKWGDTYDILEKGLEEGSEYYSGVGVIVPVKLKVPLIDGYDWVKSIQLSLNTMGDEEWVTNKYYKHFDKIEDNHIVIDFDIICTREQDYEIRLQLETINCRVYTINLKFEISDIDNVGINLYKFRKKDALSPSDFGSVYVDIDNIEYMGEYKKHTFNGEPQYLQMMENDQYGLNHVIVLKGDWTNSQNDFFESYYTVLYKNKDLVYTLCISKQFGFEPKEIPQFLLEVMYNNGYKYFSEFYEMMELAGDKIENYSLFDDESICICTDLKFGRYITEYEWEFENASSGDIFYPDITTESPFVHPDKIVKLTPGYYNVNFKYKLTDGRENVIKLNSAFKKQ